MSRSVCSIRWPRTASSRSSGPSFRIITWASGAAEGVSERLNYETKTFPESKPALQYARDHWKLSVIRAAMGVDAQGGYLGTGTGTNANKAGMLAKVNTIIQNAIDLGIYVIVDWHTSAAVTTKGTTQTADASAFFIQIATQYGTTPNVIYETYNEPTGVTWAQIKPYHEAVVVAIRAVDSDNLIVLGTPNWSQDVDLVAADPVVGTNLLYTLHFYACTHKQSLRDKAQKAISMGLPLFITEFGATPSDGGVTKNGDNYVCEGETSTWFTWMAQNNVSGASWKLDQSAPTPAASSRRMRPSMVPGPTTTSPATPPARPSTAAKRAAGTASSLSTGSGSRRVSWEAGPIAWPRDARWDRYIMNERRTKRWITEAGGQGDVVGQAEAAADVKGGSRPEAVVPEVVRLRPGSPKAENRSVSQKFHCMTTGMKT